MSQGPLSPFLWVGPAFLGFSSVLPVTQAQQPFRNSHYLPHFTAGETEARSELAPPCPVSLPCRVHPLRAF